MDVAAFCNRITPWWHPAYPDVLWRALHRCRVGKFEPAEAFRLGLFQPHIDGENSVSYISRRGLTKIQEALNPAEHAPILKNKDLFYRRCMAMEVPIPRLYAVTGPPADAWSYSGQPPQTRDEWVAFLDNHLPSEFVAKPVTGAYGHGFNYFRRVQMGYQDAFGKFLDTSMLYNALASGNRFIIQERLYNHPALVRLSDTESLQTIRCITLAGDRGDVRILHAHLKIIDANQIVDTFLDGLTGNVEAPIELASGTLKSANRVPGTGAPVVRLDVHPKTRVEFSGIQLPFWAKACDLAREVATRFVPVRTIGWDIALTPEGPVVLEGNIWWDPPNQHGCMRTLVEALTDRCGGGAKPAR